MDNQINNTGESSNNNSPINTGVLESIGKNSEKDDLNKSNPIESKNKSKNFFSFLKNKKDDSSNELKNTLGEEKKPIFGNFFGKKEKQKKDFTEDKNKKNKSKFSILSPLAGRKKTEEKAPEPQNTDTQENAFTKMFKKGDEEKEDDFIDTIIESAKSQQQKRREEDKTRSFKEITENFKTKKKEREIEGEGSKVKRLARISQIIALSSLIIPIISFAFFYTILSPGNFISSNLGINNYAELLQSKKDIVNEIESSVTELNKSKTNYEKKIEEIQDDKVLESILQDRINWLNVISKIEDITNNEFHNQVTNVITFTNYSGHNKNSEISVQGYVKDAGGMSFTRLTKLIEEMNKNDDFSGAEVRSFSKSEDKDGSAKSTFNLTFQYKYDWKEEWKDKL